MVDEYYELIAVDDEGRDASDTQEWDAGSSLTEMFDFSDVSCELAAPLAMWCEVNTRVS